MTKFLRNLLAMLLGWTGLTVAVFALGRSETAQTLRGLWPFISFLMAGVLAISCVVLFIVRKPRREAVSALVCSVVVLVLVVPRVGEAGTWLHLQLYQKQYAAVIEQLAQARNDAERKAICEKRCWFRVGTTSLQAGFYYQHFFILWSELIYDPTGEISRPRPLPGQWPNLLIRTVHLSGPWYRGDYGD